MSSPLIQTPGSTPVPKKQKGPLIHIPGSAPVPKTPNEVRRAVGKPHGSYMAGLCEQRQTIWLCRGCAHRFDFKKHNYYRERYYVIGACDACHDLGSRNNLYIHESYLAGMGGKSKHGHSWLPS